MIFLFLLSVQAATSGCRRGKLCTLCDKQIISHLPTTIVNKLLNISGTSQLRYVERSYTYQTQSQLSPGESTASKLFYKHCGHLSLFVKHKFNHHSGKNKEIHQLHMQHPRDPICTLLAPFQEKASGTSILAEAAHGDLPIIRILLVCVGRLRRTSSQ